MRRPMNIWPKVWHHYRSSDAPPSINDKGTTTLYGRDRKMRGAGDAAGAGDGVAARPEISSPISSAMGAHEARLAIMPSARLS